MTQTPPPNGADYSKDNVPHNAKMKEHKRDWGFRVRVETTPGETVHVIGSCGELGNWMSNLAVQLVKEEASESVWSAVVSLPCDQVIEFRFFVGVVIEPEDGNFVGRQTIVRRWETSVHPRIIKKEAKSNLCESMVNEADTFGVVDQTKIIERGWLTSETVVQLKLFNKPLQIWKKKYEGRKIRMKVTPVNLGKNNPTDNLLPFSESIDESVDTHDQIESNEIWPLVEIAVMNAEERELRLQKQFGREYNDDFILFQISVLDLQSVAYLVDLYAHNSTDPDDEVPAHIGFSYILPSVLRSSEGQAIIPITSTKHRPIGQLTVEYLVVRPIANYDCDTRVSYARMWKPSWQGLDVGHRGLGTSFKLEVQACSDVRENTIASLKTAALHGADLVEFDVQLTKDLVPVLYHDFHVCIAMKRKKQLEEHDMLELPVKDLTLQQLQLLKVYHVHEGRNKNPRFFDEDLEEHQPFPTLQQALELLDPHVGFNVEIKWTMQLQDGSFELYHPFDLNMYLDIVLKVVLQHAGNRKIIFSCFHPDICTMIRLKQNKYPVMFLTQGVTMKYPSYHDRRTQSIPMAVHFAVCAGILGINVHTEDVLRDPSQVKLATDAGLIIFCWGDDNNDSNTIKHLKKLGLHAIIYDKIDQFGTKEVKESIFLVEAREAQNNLLKVAKEIEQPSPTSLEFAADVGATRQTLSALTVTSDKTVDSSWNGFRGSVRKEEQETTDIN